MTNTLGTPEYNIHLITDYLVSGQLSLKSTDDLVAELQKEVGKEESFAHAAIGDDDDDQWPEIRKSSVHWLCDSDNAVSFVEKLVSEINTNYFDVDISDSAIEYQYTVYSDRQDHYDWHQDFYDDELPPSRFVRTLSVSVCLSSSEHYDGAEFFIQDGPAQNIRTFKMKYGDFIVFPSSCLHRVNMLREGKRISLVIWYGYFKPED